MIRTNLSEVDLIITGDWHIRESIPVCRTDDFWKNQWNKVNQIRNLQLKYKCPVYHSGDLFDHWKPSPLLLSEMMYNIPDDFFTVFGNHDVPQHNLELADKSGVRTLEIAGYLKILSGTHWGQEPDQTIKSKILVWHVMTYVGKPPWPGCTDKNAEQILEENPQYKLIITGHNHKSFMVKTDDGRILINPGSLTRQTADQINHHPSVYLWNRRSNSIKVHFLKCEENVISRAHLDVIEERNERLHAFIDMMKTDWQTTVSYTDNLTAHAQANRIKKPIMDIVWRSLG